jgi:tetratricopeptide (TPR) repeat protein
MLRVSYVFALVIALTAVAGADDRDKALKLFEESNKAYKSGQFEAAADLLRKAYALFPEPLLLYNLGRAQEGLGDPVGAIDSYERYLKDAKQVDDRGAIERRIATLKAQIAKQQEDERRRIEDEARRRREEEERRKQTDQRPPFSRYGPWATMGTGVALVGVGAVFGLRASAKHDDAVAAPVQRDAAELQASARTSANIANVLFVVGGLVTAAGVTWKVVQWRSEDEQSGAQLTVAPDGVAISGVFP